MLFLIFQYSIYIVLFKKKCSYELIEAADVVSIFYLYLSNIHRSTVKLFSLAHPSLIGGWGQSAG